MVILNKNLENEKLEIGVGMFGDLAFDKETRKFADPQQKITTNFSGNKIGMMSWGIDVLLWANITDQIMWFLPRNGAFCSCFYY